MRMLTLSGVPRGVLPGAGAGLEARLHPVRTTSSPSSSRPGRRERFFFIDMADSLESMRSIKMRQGQQVTARVGPSINRDTCPPGRVPTTFLCIKSRLTELYQVLLEKEPGTRKGCHYISMHQVKVDRTIPDDAGKERRLTSLPRAVAYSFERARTVHFRRPERISATVPSGECPKAGRAATSGVETPGHRQRPWAWFQTAPNVSRPGS